MMAQSLSKTDHVRIVDVIGRITNMNICSLRQTLDQAAENECGRLILDFSGVEYINSAGLRGLVELWQRSKQKQINLTIVNPSERVMTLLELVGLDTVFEIFSDLSAAAPHLANRLLDHQTCYCP